MPNQHATTVTALSIPSTAEMFVFAFAPFSENQARVRVAARLWAESLASAR